MGVAAGLSLCEATAIRFDMLKEARAMAVIAANSRLRWGVRYHAAVAGDDCLDVAKDCDAFIRQYRNR